jgi:ribosome modulation factor
MWDRRKLETLEDAWIEGWNNWLAGYMITDNPYKGLTESDLAGMWHAGWVEAQKRQGNGNDGR